MTIFWEEEWYATIVWFVLFLIVPVLLEKSFITVFGARSGLTEY